MSGTTGRATAGRPTRGRTTRRLHIDWTRCDGHGACAELLPELLATDEWGFPLSRTGERDPAVPPRLEELADHAVRTCPLMALRLL